MKQKLIETTVVWNDISIVCFHTSDNELLRIELSNPADLMDFGHYMMGNKDGMDEIENLMLQQLEDEDEANRDFYANLKFDR